MFADRQEAGRALGEKLAEARLEGELLVLGLPRGGVPVASEAAALLGARLDVLLVRKLGAPFNPELAVGAVTADGAVYNEEALEALGLDERDLEHLIQRERAELARREAVYREGRGRLDLEHKHAVLVDDGIATGATMRAAVEAARAMKALEVTVAAPTASSGAVARLERIADRVVVLSVPEPYIAVGCWYRHFPQLEDGEVVALLSTDGAPG